MLMTPDYPFVCKVAHTHAGYGKMKFEDSVQYNDFKGVIALHDDYVTAEPYIEWDYDMRIQKIGNHYRAFKRISQYWKGNEPHKSMVSDMELTSYHKAMIDECCQIFGGLDICALDLLHSKVDGKEYILELNDTAIGLVHEHEKEDMEFIRDLVLFRMSKHFCPDDDKTVIELNKNDNMQDQLDQVIFELAKEKENSVQLLKELDDLKQEQKEQNEKKSGFDYTKILIVVVLALIYAVFMRPSH